MKNTAAALRTVESHKSRAASFFNSEGLGGECDLLMEGAVSRYAPATREANRVCERYWCTASGKFSAHVLA